MLQIKNLNLTHKKDLKTILENFSCTFNDGQKAVIIGEEGNGKSTLLRWIFDPELVEDYCEAVGERIILGQSMGYLPQELPAGDRGKTVWEFFMEDGGFPDRSPGELGGWPGSSECLRISSTGNRLWGLCPEERK